MADSSRGVDPPGNRVGLVYDEKMCAHATPDGEDHPECPERIRAIWNKLQTTGVLDRCVILNTDKSEDTNVAINLVHSKNHVKLIQRVSNKSFNKKRKRIANKFSSIYFNKGSSEAAYLAAGSVVKAVEQVASGELNSAFAVVRPPGHHAEEGEPMGFCLYNNVVLATSYVLNNRPDLGIAKILIVDWDVHHGNGTQKMFWKDSRVLFFSVHRHDNGTFYPGNDDGYYNMIGEGTGIGYNINVPWENGLCGDADYLAVWDHVLIPVAKEFNPDLVIVSAGFDAAMHDPLGGCCVTPYGYSMMLRKLMDFADGKIVLALEGGYNLQSLANSVLACVQVLLDGKPISGSVGVCAFESTWRTIEAVRKGLKGYWPSLGKAPAKNLMTQTTSATGMVSSKYLKKSSAKTKTGSSLAIIPTTEDKATPVPEVQPSQQEPIERAVAEPSGKGKEVAIQEDKRRKRKHDKLSDAPSAKHAKPIKTGGEGKLVEGSKRILYGPYSLGPDTVLPPKLVRRADAVDMDLHKECSPKSPSGEDLVGMTVPANYCFKESKWLHQLPIDHLHLETVRSLEMVRLCISESWRYFAALEERCRRVEDGEELVVAVQQAEEAKVSAEKHAKFLEEKIVKLTEETQNIEKKSNETLATLKKSHKQSLEKLQGSFSSLTKERDESNAKIEAMTKMLKDKDEEIATASKNLENFKGKFVQSEEFKSLVGESIYPHWQQGVRIGVRQAVARYGGDNPAIAYFDPDYSDNCGEPDVESEGEDDATSKRSS